MNHPIPQRTLVVQPDDGVDPMLELLADAKQSLRVKQFTLSEPRIMQGLIEAHRRGVAVRVMLNPHRSSGDRPNDAVFDQLQQTGMAVQWTSPDYVVTHEKSIVVDDRRALIATFNLVLKYFTETRDYGVVTADPAQVAQVASGFDADWQHVPFHPDPQASLLRSAFDLRRELGINFDDEPIVERLSHIFSHAWDHSHLYAVPDPLEAAKLSDDELPHDPEFSHE